MLPSDVPGYLVKSQKNNEDHNTASELNSSIETLHVHSYFMKSFII